MTKIYKLLDDLKLRNIGTFEFIIALYPILSTYQYGFLPLYIFTLVILVGIVFHRNSHAPLYHSKTLKRLFIFIVVHEIALIPLLDNIPSYHINTLLSYVISFIAIPLIIPQVKWDKLVGAVNLVTLICVIGLFYQFILVQSGHEVGQIKLPFLPASGMAVQEAYGRPHSFFPEPAIYSQFMLIPMFIGLTLKNYIWTCVIAVSVLMCSSTTGLVLIFIMLIAYILVGNTSKKAKLFVALAGFGAIWVLTNTEIFSDSVNKLVYESGRTEENIRLVQGPSIVSTMHKSDFILGVPYANALDYCRGRGVPTSLYVVYSTGVYMTTFWQLLLKFGIIGFCLYLWVYIDMMRRAKYLIPIVTCIIIMMYTAALWLGATFVFHLIILCSFMKKKNQLEYNENRNNNI